MIICCAAPFAIGQTAPSPAQPPSGGAAPAGQTPAEPSAGREEEAEIPAFSEVRVSEFMTVDLIVQNDDIRNVLQKLAVQARRNIVPSRNVRTRVTATVYGAPFYDALEALLSANGLGYRERGEFIYILTAEELALLSSDERRREIKVIELDYLRPDDAMAFAKSLLSREGSISATNDQGGAGGGGGGGGVGSAPTGSTGSGGGASAVDSDSSAGIYTPNKDEYSVINAIVIHDFPENVAEVTALLQQLDTKPSQVLIEATIVQARLAEDNAFGIDFALLGDVQFTDFLGFPGGINPIGTRPQDRSPSEDAFTADDNRDFVVSTPGNTGSGPGSFKAGLIFNEIGVFLRALDQVTDATLLSNPKVMALNRQRARVLVGERVGYLETTVVENQVLQSVKFIDTGIELDMRPFILNNGMVRLELAPKVSDVSFRTLTGQGGQQQQIPDEQLQTVNTDVHIPAGYTAVLGGLFREDVNRTRSQVPILGDIPVLGTAFRGQDDSISRVEIMFLIKPTIMRDKLVTSMGDEALEWERAVRVGSREGLLPWSRERQSSRLNVEAERLAAEGEVDRALWSLRRSIELHPMQPDAVRLREKLVSSPTLWPKNSMLERIVEAGAEEAMFVLPEHVIPEPTAPIDGAPPADDDPALDDPQMTPEAVDEAPPEGEGR